MQIVATVEEVRAQVRAWRQEGLSVGLVPTMGYLHEGHKSLIDKAVEQNDRVVVSVFVNPIQFGPGEDLATYPRDLDRDAALCENAGANLIFRNRKICILRIFVPTWIWTDLPKVCVGRHVPLIFVECAR